MRSSLAKIPYRATTTATSITAAFSTSSAAGGGGGRGRGRGTPFQFTVDASPDNQTDNSKNEGEIPPPPPYGHGRGRGTPLPSSPVLPSFSSFLNNESKPPPAGRGRGAIFTNPPPPTPPPQTESPSVKPPKPNVKMPFLFVKDEEEEQDDAAAESEVPSAQEKLLRSDIVSVLSGAGRGKPSQSPAPQPEKPKSENRHIRPRPQGRSPAAGEKSSPREQLSQEEKVRKAKEILSKGDHDGGAVRDDRGGRDGRSPRGRDGDRGRGRGRRQGGGRGRGRDDDRYEESDDESDQLLIGDPADGEKVAQRLGPVVMDQLAEGIEEMASRVLPSPLDDAYMDAFETNLRIECEPEYLMEEFGTNPDIDEKPPIPLRDALEKMKPFLMVYEGIKDEEEWKKLIEETMKDVPLMKEIVDHYSGPDRVTAKEQNEELERVAKTLPASAPASVKRFTDRALLSLQSNPGWGFDKKCQFMDKVIMEVSQNYK